jgi:tetratricopeptide (TPR) repeat protein
MEWQRRIDAVWNDQALTDEERVAAIDDLARERDDDDAVALFERAGARDAAGQEAAAEPLYRAALDAGLDDDRRSQAAIQLASTIRNLGRPDEAIRILRAEIDRQPVSPLRDDALAFLALSLASAGDDRGAASTALLALAPHLDRYGRAVAWYAGELSARGA